MVSMMSILNTKRLTGVVTLCLNWLFIYAQAQDSIIIGNNGDTIVIDKKTGKHLGTRYNIKNIVDYKKGVKLIKSGKSYLNIEMDNYDSYHVADVIRKEAVKDSTGKLHLNHYIKIEKCTLNYDSARYKADGFIPGPMKYNALNVEGNYAKYGNVSLINDGGYPLTTFNSVHIINNNFYGLYFSNVKSEKNNLLHKNTLEDDILIANSSFSDLGVSGNTFNSFGVLNSNLKNVHFSDNYYTDCYDQSLRNPMFNKQVSLVKGTGRCAFLQDTISGNLIFDNWRSGIDVKKQKETIQVGDLMFSECLLQCNLNVNTVPFKKVFFNNCYFDYDFKMAGDFDTIIFSGKNVIEKEINLENVGAASTIEILLGAVDFKPVTLIFEGDVDVSNINFKYDERFRIVKNMRQESAYIKLIEKFTKAGDTKSAQRADIELKQIRYEAGGVFGTISHFFDKWYWAYGYDKKRPLIVVFATLGLFTLVNFIFWDKMNRAYKVGDEEDLKHDMTIQLETLNTRNNLNYKHPVLEKVFDYIKLPETVLFKNAKYFKPISHPLTSFYNFLWTMLYTVIIFFSIRIAKDRLHFKGNGVAVSWYLIQYLVGLVLTFFTIKFVIGF